MGDIRVKNIIVAQRIGSCGGFCQDNVRVGHGHGVLIPAGFHKPIQSFPGHVIPGLLVALCVAPGVIKNMNAQAGAHNAGVTRCPFRGEDPLVQFGKERTLRYMPIEAAKGGRGFIGRGLISQLREAAFPRAIFSGPLGEHFFSRLHTFAPACFRGAGNRSQKNLVYVRVGPGLAGIGGLVFFVEGLIFLLGRNQRIFHGR